MFWLLLLVGLNVVLINGQVHELTVPLDGVIKIETPSYPNSPPAGTKITWNLSTTQGNQIIIVCEDLRISPSDNCEKGYLKVDGAGTENGKVCGSGSGFTATSTSNKMTVEFDLNWAAGVAQCSLKSKQQGDSERPTKGGDAEVESNIHIKVGDSAYNSIYFKPMPKNMKKTWHFTTDSNARLSLSCREIRFTYAAKCDRAYLSVTAGGSSKKYCENMYDVTFITEGTTLDVVLKSDPKVDNQEISCLVQAITGKNVDEYRNAISYEMDSSEYGGKKGKKGTTCECGWANKNLQRVVNGKIAKNNEYPWMVALWVNGGHNCGGSIITKYHVLTAAHCTEGKDVSSLSVLVGSNSRSNRGGFQDKSQVIKVAKVEAHKYDKYRHHANDIAILVLEKPIRFDKITGPVCLTPKQPSINHKYITLMGWGYLGKEGNWEHPEMLRTAHMKVVDYPVCNEKYFGNFDRDNETRICTWASIRDSCNGDSGGPLVWLDPETNRYTQMGLVSFGRGCNTDFPKVNTAVSHYYEWIRETVQRTKPDLDICRRQD